jgi:hypothetical protein
MGRKAVAGIVMVTDSEGTRKKVWPRVVSVVVIQMLHVPSTIAPEERISDQIPAFKGEPVNSIKIDEDGVYGEGGL